METVIIMAPQGAGKSRNAALFMTRFGCTRLVDDWDGRTPLQPGDLALTNTSPVLNVPQGARVWSLDKALKLCVAA